MGVAFLKWAWFIKEAGMGGAFSLYLQVEYFYSKRRPQHFYGFFPFCFSF